MKIHTTLICLVTLLPFASARADESDETTSTWRGQSITEFEESKEKQDLKWQVVNDGVMGGLSQGKLEITDDGTMRFTGNLSLKNNGGFSTVRSGDVSYNLSNDLGLLLRVKGDGRTYEARLSSDARYRGMEVSFSGKFETKKGEWTQVKIPFPEFEGSFRGIELKNEVLNPANIQRIGILLGDKQEGPFELEVDYIRTYGKGQGSITDAVTDSGPEDIVDTAVADGRFSILATAVKTAGLIETLKGDDQLTVFAPTDEAFAKLPKKVVDDLLKPENREKLASILTFHVVPGAVEVGDALKAGEAETVQGSGLEFAFRKGKVQVNDAALIDANVQCSNGVIHVIDSVLLPPEPEKPTILTAAREAGSFSTLLTAIEAAGLTSALEGDGPFTVLA
ncbi:MAG: hypothetical protein HKN23_09550, partial [Verrucomicrobiales bacterium]|nr:hypothetical protein [Verrucomicrobiales bacterium]